MVFSASTACSAYSTYDKVTDFCYRIPVSILLKDFQWISSLRMMTYQMLVVVFLYGYFSGIFTESAVYIIMAMYQVQLVVSLHLYHSKFFSLKQQLHMRMYQILVVVFLYRYYSGIFSESAVYIWQCIRCWWWYFCIYTTQIFSVKLHIKMYPMLVVVFLSKIIYTTEGLSAPQQCTYENVTLYAG